MTRHWLPHRAVTVMDDSRTTNTSEVGSGTALGIREQHPAIPSWPLVVMSDQGLCAASQAAEQSNAKNPACDVCREKKVRCGREKPECENCKLWKTACTYSERLKRENDQSRLAQRFDEVHDRLERIESAVHRLTTAVERVAAQDPASLTVAQTTSASPPPSGHSLARGVDETPTLQRSSQTKPGAFIADKHGELHFLGANSLPSITSEAESVAQQRIRLKLPTLSGRSRTEASNVLRRLSGLKVDASSVVPDYEWEGINVNAGRWWFPDRDVAIHISHEYFNRANAIYPIFRRESYMQRLHGTYDHPDHTLDIAWLTSFNNVLLFGLYAVTKAHLEECEQLVKRLVGNTWMALTDTKLFLTPRLINVQALMMSAVVAQESSRPGLCWTLVCQACRLAQAVGLHRRSDTSQFRDEGDYEERKWTFWNLYVMDKTLSLTFGRSACIPDYDIDVELPKKSDEICWSLFVAWISLAKIQSRTYERLYSATANASGPDERRAAVVELDGQLRRWSADNSKLKADWPPNIMEEKYVEVELRFTYHLSLLLIHRVDHGSGTQSEDICLDSARNAIGAIQMTVAEDSDLAESGLLLWLYLYYPFTPFFTLFTHIVRNPQSSTTKSDLELIRFIWNHLERMKERHAGADRLARVASAFVRIAETLLGEHGPYPDRTLTGKRKRGTRPVPETRQSSSELVSDEQLNLDFLRPLQQQQQQQQQQPQPQQQTQPSSQTHGPSQPFHRLPTALSDQLQRPGPSPIPIPDRSAGVAQFSRSSSSSSSDPWLSQAPSQQQQAPPQQHSRPPPQNHSPPPSSSSTPQEAVHRAEYELASSAAASSGGLRPPFLFSAQDQNLLGGGQGPFDFDWVLWDQTIESDLGALPDPFAGVNPASAAATLTSVSGSILGSFSGPAAFDLSVNAAGVDVGGSVGGSTDPGVGAGVGANFGDGIGASVVTTSPNAEAAMAASVGDIDWSSDSAAAGRPGPGVSAGADSSSGLGSTPGLVSVAGVGSTTSSVRASGGGGGG